MKKTTVMWVILAIVLGLLIIGSSRMKQETTDTPMPTQAEVTVQTDLPLTKDYKVVAKARETRNDDYKLVVGANPRLNNQQTFSPPTNSVAITNEIQLQQLIEQTKKSRQQQTVQQ